MLVLDQLHFAMVLTAQLGCGLIAGVFFAFSTFVMNALSRLPSREGITAMQSINITVLNLWFLGVFISTAVFCILLIAWSLFLWNQMNSGYLIAGSMIYLFGSFMVTVIFNVPKNEVLKEVDAFAADSESLWRNYVDEWTAWNHVRTIASFLAAACFGVGLN